MHNLKLKLYSPILFVVFCCFASLGFSQYKKVLDLDTVLYPVPPAYFNAAKIVETDLPGREISIFGAFFGNDANAVSRQAAFHWMGDRSGNPVRMDCYEDSASFLFQGPRVYSACYNGGGTYYIGMGSNNKQLVMKIDTTGTMHWSKAANHHDFYGIVCEGSSVTALGQDESILGVHDFSLVRYNQDGSSGSLGTMFGAAGFDLPEKLMRDGNHYVMTGSAFSTTDFGLMTIKADAGYNQIWGNIFGIAGKSFFSDGITRSADGTQYYLAGRVRGGSDSLYLSQMDSAGNLGWTKAYGIGGATEIYMNGMAMDPVSGGFLLCGQYRGPQYLRPYVLKVDHLGDLEWIRDYGDPGNGSDEGLNDIICSSNDGYFYAIGDYLEIDSPDYNHKIVMIKALPDSGAMPCSALMVGGQRSMNLSLIGNSQTQQFSAHYNYSMGYSFSSTTEASVRCSVIVALPDRFPDAGDWVLVNPTAGDLLLQAEVPMGGGQVRVLNMTGQQVHAAPLAEGMQRYQTRLPNLPNGMYWVTLSGDGWAYSAKKWLIQK
jgi:hypothetical protein